MMKAYKVMVGTVDCEGRYTGKKTIGYVATIEKMEAKIAQYRADHEKNQWWMGYETDRATNGIKFYTEEIEIEM